MFINDSFRQQARLHTYVTLQLCTGLYCYGKSWACALAIAMHGEGKDTKIEQIQQ